MTRFIMAVTLAVVFLMATIARGQSLPSFEDLSQKVNNGDHIRVEDFSGGTTTGRLTLLSRDSITLQTAGGDRRLTLDSVREVAVRRGSSSTGAIAGAAAGALAGAMKECGGGKDKHCSEGVVMLGLFGAGCGAIAGALVPHMATVYRAPMSHAAIAPVASPGNVGVVVRVHW